MSRDGHDVTQSLMQSIKDKLALSSQGYVLVKLALRKEELDTARQELYRSLADNHCELDIENKCNVEKTYGIGKVDCLPQSCLELQVLPCLRKLFGHLLGVDSDSLLSTLDVPQYVPPGQDQKYMGLSIGKTSIIGILCLTSQLVTESGLRVSPGTLILYDTKSIEIKATNILPKNPDDALFPWMGLRIAFWDATADKYGSPEDGLRRELFLQGRFGLHFQQSPFAVLKDISDKRLKYIRENKNARYFVPINSKSRPLAVPNPRQLYYDEKDGHLKWMAGKMKAKASVNTRKRTHNGTPNTVHAKISRYSVTETVPLDEVLSICKEMIFPEPISPLPASPAIKVEKCPLTELVYDSMYDESDEEVTIVNTVDSHPNKPCKIKDVALTDVPLDYNLTLSNFISSEKIGIYVRSVKYPNLSNYVFCNTDTKNKENSNKRCFCCFRSMQDDVYEVRGAENVYDMIRIFVYCKDALARMKQRQEWKKNKNSYFTIMELFEQDENLSNVTCEGDKLYAILRVPQQMVLKKKPWSSFNKKEHEKHSMPNLEVYSMTEEKLKAIEWNNRAKAFLGNINNAFDTMFPAIISGGEIKDKAIAVSEKVRDLCNKMYRIIGEPPPSYHILTIQEILDRHESGIKQLLYQCREWMRTNAEIHIKCIASVIKEQLYIIKMMAGNNTFRYAYAMHGMNPKDIFLNVICTQLQSFKMFVQELEKEINMK